MATTPAPRDYLSVHGMDVILLVLLLGADVSWITLHEPVNAPFLVAALTWSLVVVGVVVARKRPAAEIVIAVATSMWCAGNGLWTVYDFGYETGETTYLGVRFTNMEPLVDGAGACFVVSFATLAWFFYDAWSRRANRGYRTLEDETDSGMDALANEHLQLAARRPPNGILDLRASARGGARGASPEKAAVAVAAAGTSGAARDVEWGASDETDSVESHEDFPGFSFLPNALSLRTRAEYEGLAHFLWIAKDLCWWLAVEQEVAGFRYVTCAAAAALILHTVDQMETARREEDLMELCTQTTTLCWVLAMSLWSVGEMFQGEEVAREGASMFAYPERLDNLRWWAAWTMTTGAVFFSTFWVAYLSSFAMYPTESETEAETETREETRADR